MFSSIDLLKRIVRAGAKNEVRSFIIAGLILYISDDLFEFIFSLFLLLGFLLCVAVGRGVMLLFRLCFLFLGIVVWFLLFYSRL